METYELEIEKKSNIEKLDLILKAYQSTEKKNRKVLIFILIVCAIAIYYMFFDLLGGIWGYIFTIAIIGAVVFYVNELGITFKSNTASDGKLAYQACTTMEILIAIKKGTYHQYGAYVLSTGSGEHYNLYKQFISLYPEYKNKSLEKLSKVKVEPKDILN